MTSLHWRCLFLCRMLSQRQSRGETAGRASGVVTLAPFIFMRARVLLVVRHLEELSEQQSGAGGRVE